MTALPANAPFPPDAIAALNRVISDTSPTQRSWLSGFLAGIEAATAAPAVVAAPLVRPALTVLFATESGNSEALARKAAKDAGRLGFAAKVLDAAEATPADLAKSRNLLVVASTWGEGEPPQRAIGLLEALMGACWTTGWPRWVPRAPRRGWSATWITRCPPRIGWRRR